MQKQKTVLPPFLRPSNWIRRVLLSWLLAVVIEYLLLPAQLRDLSGLEGLRQMSLPRLITVACVGTLFLSALSRFCKTRFAERWAFAVLFACLAIPSLLSSYSPALLGICLLILLILVIYALRGRNRRPEPIQVSKPVQAVYLWCTAFLTLVFFLIISAWTVGRVAVFGASTYDLGIFAQMFHNMKETGLPMTTLERDTLLSHFDVHVSPIYYLMLPLYCLAPNPATLQILQAAVMASAVIPLWKICGQYGLSGSLRTLLCGTMLFYPAFGCGASNDLHENCFLTPLLLWLLYGIGKKSIPITAIAASLTLLVKEDSAVYLAVIGLWLLVQTLLRTKHFDRQNLVTAILMLGSSLVWFYLTTGHLAQNGDGVMTYRYNNFIFDGSDSLICVIQAVILNPMKAIYECVDQDKLKYIAFTILPLLGFPLLTRRYERYILLIPYVLINLMSDYPYQHSIWFQYNFGSTALLMYLTAVNIADLKSHSHRTVALLMSAIICFACFQQTVYKNAANYSNLAITKYDYYQQIRDTLDQIPKDTSVTATGYYTTHLSDREIIYDLRYTTREHLLESEYVVISVTDRSSFKKFASNGQENGLENLLLLLDENEYELFAEIDGVLQIYRRTRNST